MTAVISRTRQIHWRRFLPIVFYAVISLALLAPMASDVPAGTPDLADHLAIIVQARLAIDQGQIPLRVAPFSYNSWGYPLFQFYSQIPYLAAGLLYEFVSPSNPYVAYKLTLWLVLTFAGFFVYRLAFWFTRSRVASLLAGFIYIAAPYFLIDLHARGAFTEACAQGVLPAVLYFTVRCYASRNMRWLVPAAVSWFALATTHLITFVYGALFAGLFLLLLGVMSKRKIGRLVKTGLAFGLGATLAAFFLAPDILASYLRVRDLLWPPYSYNWLTPLSALLSPVSIPPEPLPGELTTPLLYPAVGWPMLIAAGLVAYFLLVERGLARSTLASRLAASLLITFALAVFTTWSPIDFWSLLPEQLRIVQFPYRMLTQVMWSGALLSAVALAWAFRGRLDGRHLAVGTWVIGLAASSYLPSPRTASFKVSDIVAQPGLVTGVIDYLVKTELFSNGPKPTNLETIPLKYWDDWLMLDQDHALSACLSPQTPGAMVYFKGAVPVQYSDQTITLSFLYNSHVIAQKQIGGGPFEWTIPLNAPFPSNPTKKDKSCTVAFSADQTFVPAKTISGSTDTRHLAVRADSIYLKNADPELTVLPVAETEKMCQPTGAAKTCEISVPAEARWVQLPELFYPGLLSVSVDGHPADYVPIQYQDIVLAGLRLEPGKHSVRIEFQGIAWANWLSLAAWLGVLVFIATATAMKMRIRWPLG